MKMQLDVPPELNKLLRKFALDSDKGSREKATLFILKNFLLEIYKIKND